MTDEFLETTLEAESEGLSQEESIEVESDGGESEEAEKPSKTVSDDIRKAIDSLKEPKEKVEGEEPPKLDEKVEKKGPGRPKNRIVEAQDITTVEPPAQLDAKTKQVFNKLPRELKTAYTKMVGNAQSENHRIYGQVQQLHSEYGDIAQAIKPYLNDWGMRGSTPAQAIRQLAAVNQYLIQKREDGVVDLIKSMQLDGNLVAEKLLGRGQNGGAQDQPQNTSYNNLSPELTEELKQSRLFREQLLNQAQSQQQAQVQHLGTNIAHEIKSVMDETDGAGFYKYPKLHDDGYRRGLEKLVLTVKEEQPSLSWSESFKVAYNIKENNGAPRASYTNPQQIKQLRTGSVSVRGRGMVNGTAIPKAGKNESMRDTIGRAIAMQKGGKAY